MPAHPHTQPPSKPGDGSQRLTWPDVAILVVVISFVIFLMYRGMTPEAATITAISTTAAVFALLLLPRRITDAVELLRRISRAVNHSGPGGA